MAKCIGQGTFGTVFEDGPNRAQKVISTRWTLESMEEIGRELQALAQTMRYQRARHLYSDKIVRIHLIQIALENDSRLAITITMDRGECSLQDRFLQSKNNWDIDVLLSDMRQAFTFCHFTLLVIIRDVSPCNILVRRHPKDIPSYVLIDLGKVRMYRLQKNSAGNMEQLYSPGYHGAPSYQPTRSFLSYSQRRSLSANSDWRTADWFSLGAVALCACNPQRYWDVYDNYAGNNLMFSYHGIRALLSEFKEILSPSARAAVSGWIMREIDMVSPLFPPLKQ